MEGPEPEKIVEAAFKGLLTPQAWNLLKSLPPNALQPQQKDILAQLYHHFVVPNHIAESRLSAERLIEDDDAPILSSRKTPNDSVATHSDLVDSKHPPLGPPKKRGRPRKFREPLESLASGIDSRWTRHGEPYEEAMKHFEDLEIAERAKESGANALGDNIRTFLRRRYNVHTIGIGEQAGAVLDEGADL